MAGKLRTVSTFDPESHIYTRFGVRVPTVSEIARQGEPSFYSMDPGPLAKGRIVHSYTRVLDWQKDHVDRARIIATAPPHVKVYAPELMAYAEFLTECEPHWSRTEEPETGSIFINGVLYGFGGCADRLGYLKQSGKSLAVLDIKTGTPEPWHRVQTAGYDLLYRQGRVDREHTRTRYALYLKSNGRYALDTHREPGDFSQFAERLVSLYGAGKERA